MGQEGVRRLGDRLQLLYDYAPDSTAQRLFDDSALGVSTTDFYVGKNGWAITPDMG